MVIYVLHSITASYVLYVCVCVYIRPQLVGQLGADLPWPQSHVYWVVLLIAAGLSSELTELIGPHIFNKFAWAYSYEGSCNIHRSRKKASSKAYILFKSLLAI